MGSYSIWEKMEGEERGHMAYHEKPDQFDLDLVYRCIWKLRRPLMFIKYKDHPWEGYF